MAMSQGLCDLSKCLLIRVYGAIVQDVPHPPLQTSPFILFSPLITIATR